MSQPGKFNIFRRLTDFFYGYDFFISYSRRHGEDDNGGLLYAERLNALLEGEGFKCFLDSNDYAMGDAWKGVGARKLKLTSQLILVASEAALDAPAVVREVEVFHQKSKGRIIPIDFGGTIRQRDESKAIFQILQDDILFLEEPPSLLATGPSADVIHRLKAGFNLRRQDSKRSRFFAILAVVFGIISIVAGGAGLMAYKNAQEAQRNEVMALENEAKSNKNLIESYTIQGQESMEREEYSRGAALLAQAIRKADATGQPDIAEEATLRLSSLMTGGHFVALEGALAHPGTLREIQYSPSGRFISTVTMDSTQYLWQRIETGRWTQVQAWRGACLGKHLAAFNSDESNIIVASGLEIGFYKTEDGKTFREPLIMEKPIYEIALTNDEAHLVVKLAEGEDRYLTTGAVLIVEISSGRIVKKFAPIEGPATVRSDGNLGIFGLDLVNLNPPFESRKLPFASIEKAYFRGLSPTLLITDGQTPLIFNIETWTKSEISTEDHYGEPLAKALTEALAYLQLDDAGEVMLVEQIEGLTGERYRNILTEVRMKDLDYQKRGWGYQGFHALPNRNVSIGHRGEQFVIEKGGESVEVWDKEAVIPISAAVEHRGSVTRVEFSPDDTEFATISGDGVLRIWNTSLLRNPTKEETLSFPDTSPRWVFPAIFLHDHDIDYEKRNLLYRDSRYEITKDDLSLTVRDIQTGKVILGPFTPGGEVISATLSPDGNSLACGHMALSYGVEAWATVWNLKTGDRVMRIDQGGSDNSKLLSSPGGEDKGTMGVVAVAFHPSSRKLATLFARNEGDGDRSYTGWETRRARVWDIAKKRPSTDWLAKSHLRLISEEDHKRLNCTAEEAEGYLQELTMQFSKDGETLQFKIKDELVQEWAWANSTDKKLLLKSADALSGTRYSEKLGRLVRIPNEERIQLWQTIRKNATMMKFLNGK